MSTKLKKQNAIIVSRWDGCYDASWKGAITNQSFAHPAKMSRALLERIILHGFEMGYWKRGDRIGDCFGGVGTTGIICAYNGLEAVLCELEPKFIGFANENFAMHKRHWETMGLPLPRIIQGDSRKFDEHVAGIVSSPPYADCPGTPSLGSVNKDEWGKDGRDIVARRGLEKDYGNTSGQIGSLKSGAVEAVISSPPFATQQTGGGLAKPDAKYSSAKHGNFGPEHFGRFGKNHGYQNQGDSDGNIASLKEGTVAGVISSPPYSDIAAGAGGLNTKPAKKPGQQSGRKADSASQGKRVRLCGDTLRLLEHIGFVPIERIHAMLVTETVENGLFGEERTKRQRKSFFRRLYEAKLPEQDERRIDHEEVLICRRP